MDLVQTVVSIVPVPYLRDAYSLLDYIYKSVQQVQASKTQLSILAETTARLLTTLNTEYLSGTISERTTVRPLGELKTLLQEIAGFVRRELDRSFLTLLFTKGDRIEKIDAFNRRIAGLVQEFQISSALQVHDWQSRNDAARNEDQRQLSARLDALQNQGQLMETLQINQENMIAMMVSLMRRVDGNKQDSPERRFYSRSLLHLSAASGRQIELQDWMVTTYDVDVGLKIGSGSFGDVYRGTWHKADVAIKMVRTGAGVIPTSMAIRREIEIWSKLRHPNVLPFFGANDFDDTPFIVMRYMPNGNAREFLQKIPTYNRLNILRNAALGLLYLHSQNIVHGDLKALNILIDNDGTAVLCDFGLSRVKADMMSRSAEDDVGSELGAGSRNWMSPERLRGGLPKKASDIYAFGMTVYEIFAGETPLGHVMPQELRYLVTKEKLRPDKCDANNIPVMPDQIWEVAAKCWVQIPDQRPSASTLCDMLGALSNIFQPPLAPHTSVPLIPTPPLVPGNSQTRTVIDLDSVIDRLLEVRGYRPGKAENLQEYEIQYLCTKASEIMLSQPVLLELDPPVKVLGDIHGQYYDLLRFFELGGYPPDANYLFLGNYVNHGKQSLETICLLLAYKIKYPVNFFLLRGNHECMSLTKIYGFYDECKRRYNIKLWRTFIDCFNCFPFAAIISNRIFAVHGGLSPDLKSMDQIRQILRPTDIPEIGLLSDLLWSDPKDITGWAENNRGVSFTFGLDIIARFLKKHDLYLICRSHQIVEDGYEFFAKQHLVTLFSAPNYRKKRHNAGALMSVDEGLYCNFQVLKPMQ